LKGDLQIAQLLPTEETGDINIFEIKVPENGAAVIEKIVESIKE